MYEIEEPPFDEPSEGPPGRRRYIEGDSVTTGQKIIISTFFGVAVVLVAFGFAIFASKIPSAPPLPPEPEKSCRDAIIVAGPDRKTLDCPYTGQTADTIDAALNDERTQSFICRCPTAPVSPPVVSSP